MLVAADSIDVESNGSLTTVAALGALHSTTSIGVNSNPALTSLHGLEQLTTLSGDLSIEDDALLVDLSPLAALAAVRSLYIGQNAQLTSLGLTALTSVTLNFAVTDNATLDECLVAALLACVGTPQTVATAGNDTTTCP